MRRTGARLAATALAFLIPLCLFLMVLSTFQSSLLFPVGAVPKVAMPTDARPLEIIAADGRSRLEGLHYAPQPGTSEPALILGFGGNGWNAIHVAQTLRELFPGDHVVVFFYRGYPPSQGDASSAALVADAPLTYDVAVRATGAGSVILAGFSIGSGVAATLAASRPVAGLILVTPFDRLENVAADLYPFVPVSLLFRHDIDAAGALRSVRAPIAIVAAADDEIILPERTAGLRAAASMIILDRTIPAVGHNDIYSSPAFVKAMRDARSSFDHQPKPD